MFSSDDLLRFESLGDNCELGLVLRALGSENSGFFRWALAPSAAIPKVIESNFTGVFQKKNIVPHSKIMVRDELNGIAYHSNLKSDLVDGKLSFLGSGERWSEIFELEAQKISHLAEKFLVRVKDPSVIFMFKSRRGITPDDLELLYEVLCEKAGRPVNFVHVEERGGGGPSLISSSPNRAVASIDRFAPYMDANDSLKDQWHVIMRSVLKAFE